MTEIITYWTKTSGDTYKSKMHLSGNKLNVFCGIDTYHYELGGQAIGISEDRLFAEYVSGTSVYQKQAFLPVPTETVCQKCLKRALIIQSQND